MGTPQPVTKKPRRVSTEVHPGARFVSIAAAAVVLGVGETSAWRLTQSGELPTVLLGRRRLIPRAALDAFEAKLLAQGSDRPVKG